MMLNNPSTRSINCVEKIQGLIHEGRLSLGTKGYPLGRASAAGRLCAGIEPPRGGSMARLNVPSGLGLYP